MNPEEQHSYDLSIETMTMAAEHGVTALNGYYKTTYTRKNETAKNARRKAIRKYHRAISPELLGLTC